MDLENMIQRIDQLLEKGDTKSEADISEIATETTTLFELAYGKHSTQLEQVLELQKLVYEGAVADFELFSFRDRLCGCLRTLKSGLTEGRIVNLEVKVRGEVYGDLVASARRALDEGQEKAAAVLACAALEDSLKQWAKNENQNVDGKRMPEVINALKSVGAIRDYEGKELQAFSKVRDKAFHAEWEAIDIKQVNLILLYIEDLLGEHFSNQPLK